MAGPRSQQHHSLGMPSSDSQIQPPSGSLPQTEDEGLLLHHQKNHQAALQALQEEFATRPGLLKVLFPFIAM